MAMTEEDARKQRMANDAISRQPTYKHNRETSWNTYLLERADYIDALNLTAVLELILESGRRKLCYSVSRIKQRSWHHLSVLKIGETLHTNSWRID